MDAGNSADSTAVWHRNGAFRRVLLEVHSAAPSADFHQFTHTLCRSARELFATDAAYYFELVADELIATHCDGVGCKNGLRFKRDEVGPLSEALQTRETVYFNYLDRDTDGLATHLQASSIMVTPLTISDEVVGAFVLAAASPGFFNDDLAANATLLVGYGSALAEAARLRQASREETQRAEDLMSLARDFSSSLGLPDFVRSFVNRAADMLGARAAVLALHNGKALEAVEVHGTQADKVTLRRLNGALGDLATARPESVVTGPAAELLGSLLAAALGWHDLIVARLTEADNELLGVLCLADRDRELSPADRNLLQAIAGQASVALENSRLFSRIARSNRHWMEIFDSITDFLVVHDENLRVLRVNQPLAGFIGVRPSELIGMSMRALVSMAADTGAHACPFCRAGKDKDDEYVQLILERTYLVSTSRVRGALDEGLQTIHVLKDITDRREAERRYRELFETIQEGIFFSTPEGRFIEVNDALVRMLGYGSREELLQVDIPRQLYPTAEQRQAFLEAIEQRGVVRNFEESLRRKDGSLVHTLENAFAVRDAHGCTAQYRGVMLDITELKTFQAQLLRERDFNTKILNNTQSMILVADTAGVITYANRRCFTAWGYKEDQLLGRSLLDLAAPGKHQVFSEAIDATRAGHQVDNLEVPLLRGDGGFSHFSINLSPMRDERGEVASLVVVMSDVTDAAMLQAKLMHAEKMAAVGQLVSGVAHEVNNPLTAILGFADLLLDQDDLPGSARKDLQVILQEAQRTKQIVQNLLRFARQTPARRQPVELNSILRHTLQLRAYDFSSHGLEVVELLDEGLPEIVGDSHQLQQVFLNMLNNAYDAVRETSHPGRIEVQTAHGSGWVEVVFRDNGPGIAFPDRIFDPFFTTKEVGKGTGLGLSICYGIVREHGGEIACFNNTDQPGATFIVRIPAVAEARTSVAAAGAQA
jgi:two-component system NtrC family sensor kinase